MAQVKYKILGTSTTTPINNTKRKEVTVGQAVIYSQQVDLSDFIGMDPDKKIAIQSLPYEFRTKEGDVLLKGNTDELGDTGRIFTHTKEDVILYVGEGKWSLSIDCKHEL
ncbi:hypothetical protein AAKU55_005884 [Oxalobacteraceae bacterium GrIS 1.11]